VKGKIRGPSTEQGGKKAYSKEGKRVLRKGKKRKSSALSLKAARREKRENRGLFIKELEKSRRGSEGSGESINLTFYTVQ